MNLSARWASSRHPLLGSCAALLLAGGSSSAWSKPGFIPFVAAGVQHNSNVFMRPSGESPLAAEGISGLGDTIEEYTAGFTEQIGQVGDRLRLSAQGSRETYNRFTMLSHFEYRFGGDLDWRLGPVVDGRVTYDQSRYMAPFTDTLALQLLLDTERTLTGTVRVHVTPVWRVDLSPGLHRLDTPLPGFPDFKLQETLGAAGLDYLGFGRLVSGLRFEYIRGRYSGIVGATRYEQRGAELRTTYKVSGFSSFAADFGYARRDSQPNAPGATQGPVGGPSYEGYAGTVGTTSGATGALTYRRQFTGKTSADISVFRKLESYAAGANPEIGTGGAVGVTWKPDVKTSVHLSYSMEHDNIQGGIILANLASRSDRSQTAAGEIDYRALRWLIIKPYASWDRATSSYFLGNYSATIVGVTITARFE